MSLIILDVSFGIFAVMTIIAGLVIGILVARVVYIDKWYEKMIEKYEIVVEDIIEELEDNNIDNAGDDYRYLLEHAFAYKNTIGTNKSRRYNNRYIGVILDITIILSIIAVGLLTVLSIFEINILLVTTLLILAIAPLLHFSLHIHALREESNV